MNLFPTIYSNMKPIWSIDDITLDPKPGKKYWKNCHREWREEFIYFLLVDRFHDDLQRRPTKTDRSKGFGNEQQLKKICGGTIRGIINNLDWIYRSIVRHDSATKVATDSGAKFSTVPLQRWPLIPLQSTPVDYRICS